VPGLASGTAQGTLPWSRYSYPELRREQERVFGRGRQYAGPAEHAAEPASFFTCEVGNVGLWSSGTATATCSPTSSPLVREALA
jgi:hypothetical protein